MIDWEKRYRELYCDVWQCPPEEFGDSPEEHASVCREARNQSEALVTIRDVAHHYQHFTYPRVERNA